MPGMFVRVLLPNEREDVLLVPDLAIQRDLAGPFLLVVNQEDEVESRYVTLGPKVDDDRIIEDGLEGDERVVVNGLQRARPGIKVEVQVQGSEEAEAPAA